MFLEDKQAIHQSLSVEDANDIYLIGSQCNNCEEIFFPIQSKACLHCNQEDLIQVKLSTEGMIHAFTIVNQTETKDATPYAYGIVCLPEGVNVYTLFTKCDYRRMHFGQKARLVVERLENQKNNNKFTYKFEPIFKR